MRDEYDSWSNSRNTGMEISWHYSPEQDLQPEYKFDYDNTYFTHLANIIHEDGGLTDHLEQIVSQVNRQKVLDTECSVERVSYSMEYFKQNPLSERYENVSYNSIYKDEITEETLEMASKIYFGIVFCPSAPEIVTFYQEMIYNRSAETVLKTLARILYVSNSNGRLAQHYRIAKALFDKMTDTMGLQYRNIAIRTTAASQLEFYQELKDFKDHQEFSTSSTRICQNSL